MIDPGNAAQISSALFSLLALGMAWRAHRNAQQDELGQRVDAHELRLGRVESELQHLPDKDTAHRLEMAVARLEGRLETMDERLKPVAAIASRMQDVLIEGGRK